MLGISAVQKKKKKIHGQKCKETIESLYSSERAAGESQTGRGLFNFPR